MSRLFISAVLLVEVIAEHYSKLISELFTRKPTPPSKSENIIVTHGKPLDGHRSIIVYQYFCTSNSIGRVNCV